MAGSRSRRTTAPRARRARAWAAGVALLLLPSLARAQEGAEEAAGGGIFSLDLGLVIWTWLLFLLTLAILAWKVFPAISGGLEERHRKIQGAIDEARRAREEAAALRKEQQAALEASRREAQELLEKARSAGEDVRKEILADARAQQQALLEEARREIDLERDKLREEIRREAVDVALAAAERLLRKRLDGEENRRLVREFVSDL